MMPSATDAQQAVAAAIRELLEQRPPSPADPSERALCIALVDKRVHDALVAHLSRGEIYIGASYLARYSAQEHVVLILEFRRLPPRIAFVPLGVALRVNVDSGEVEAVIDPYRGEPLGPAARAAGPGQSATTTAGAFFPRGTPEQPA